MTSSSNLRIVVLGLGYVGLPLAVALARKFEVTGFDIDSGRIAELREGRDRTGEIESDALRQTATRSPKPGMIASSRDSTRRSASALCAAQSCTE